MDALILKRCKTDWWKQTFPIKKSHCRSYLVSSHRIDSSDTVVQDNLDLIWNSCILLPITDGNKMINICHISRSNKIVALIQPCYSSREYLYNSITHETCWWHDSVMSQSTDGRNTMCISINKSKDQFGYHLSENLSTGCTLFSPSEFTFFQSSISEVVTGGRGKYSVN